MKRYKIRKLTPRECYRLMGVDDEDIDKMLAEKTLKDSNHYKLAGNSIVVNCMVGLFDKLFINRNEPKKKDTKLW
jgi:site-specific DNA-cytosine methylase